MKRKITVTIVILLILVIISGLYIADRTKNQIKELFKLNKERQEQGYYMAEFEFKMLGMAYDLDRGHYYSSLKLINQLHHQLKTTEGLIKVPEFNNKAEELEFYLALQNPNTGAFMDDAYPYCTYTGPTGNVLLHLDKLAEETGRPLQLKYPLKYLDQINTPERMKAYLDDVSTVGWIASKFPQTSFHFARDIFSLFYEDNTVAKNGLYDISPETQEFLLQWFYEHQDPATGLWGPKSKSGQLITKDTSNTISIMKAFVDDEGNNVYAEFPLRYKDELTQSILEELFNPVPPDDELDAWHEWNLKTSKSIKALTKYLWSDISEGNRERVKDFIEYYIRLKFEKFYIPEEGAFSYYPHGEHATIDGTNEFLVFDKIGALSGETQARLWGAPEANITDLGLYRVSSLGESDLRRMADFESVNSLRIYKSDPDYRDLTSGVAAIVYPRETAVLDIADLIPRVKRWIDSTDQNMGNWVSKEEIVQALAPIEIEAVPIYANNMAIESLNEIMKENEKLVVVGFDVLQVPRCQVVYERLPVLNEGF